MKYEISNLAGQELLKRTKVINQAQLTSDCWMLQAWGLPYCRDCDLLATEDCGGYRIRKLILQSKYPVDGLPEISGSRKSYPRVAPTDY